MNFKRIFSIPCCIGLLFSSANALPTAKEVFAKMGMGYNIGNTLEVPMNPSAWGNDFPTQELIDSVKSAGFNTVRIPCAWYSHSNAIAVDSNWTLYTPDGDENTINAAWLDSVKTVVDYVVKRDMYAILNIHWDNGWLEDHIGTSVDEKINARQKSYWEQIAAKFKDYDEHLLFASTNEPGESGDGLKQDNANTLKAYHETMIKAVRSSGGNNATRTIIVQAPDTDENKAHNYLKGNFPADPAGTDYMMGEFHFYPYTFALMEQDADWGNTVRYWGEGNYSTTDVAHNVKKGAYASPEYVDSVFAMLGEDFKDIPMVIGEFGVIKRLELKAKTFDCI
ncbi:Cellulase (glycosyl hydrolase family 5) [Fibrobacter sp. UWH9]|uniref:glycoside hydrolase family 5 protein n=1 Tax=unclassified Fibrobacter TaxID=2634177 RepID=UPI000911FA2A|nr:MULTISPECIES: glycoside hydrolase family 5 protein [unclassified Fibrobacter]SHH89430.1 Cellulase (glycosyl hydrolase family 5) [Fibrobacter sp. UWH9]SHL34217.1 Cellulase (glycosyl hydrolase family 5) [Fibrobacter sp. UWH5]